MFKDVLISKGFVVLMPVILILGCTGVLRDQLDHILYQFINNLLSIWIVFLSILCITAWSRRKVNL